LNALESLFERLRRRHKHLVLCGPHTQPYALMEKAGFLDRIGRQNVVGNVTEALDRARIILKLPIAQDHGVSAVTNPRVEQPEA
jgi:SulP family sulfate permease